MVFDDRAAAYGELDTHNLDNWYFVIFMLGPSYGSTQFDEQHCILRVFSVFYSIYSYAQYSESIRSFTIVGLPLRTFSSMHHLT